MEAWGRERHVWASNKVNFYAPCRSPLQGTGARALEPISVGETLLEVPLTACLTPLTLEDAPAFMDEQQKLMLRLLHEDRVLGLASSWRAYIDALPRNFTTLPLWYNDAEVGLLQGTSVDTLLTGAHIANAHELKAMLDWCETREDLFPVGALNEEALRWSASVVASRSFESADVGVVLAPFADAMNHSSFPHTRMRDSGKLLTFTAERCIVGGEEVFNCYGLRGNVQWLMNGGFVENANPFDSLPISISEAVSAALLYLGGPESTRTAKDQQREDSESFECTVCQRFALLQRVGIIGDEPFQSTLDDLLPDELATLLVVLCMSREDFQRYEHRSETKPVIEVADEEVPDSLLESLHGCLVHVVDLVGRRYTAKLLEDEETLFRCEVHCEDGAREVKRPRVSPNRGAAHETLPVTTPASDVVLALEQGARIVNVKNILSLRVSQKRILEDLRRSVEMCSESDTDDK